MADVGLPEGVSTPEMETENRRKLVVDVCVQLDKPNNLEEFKNSVVKMFESFGLKHTSDPDLLDDDNNRWATQYEWRHSTSRLYTDIEFHGQTDPNNTKWVQYANIYINRVHVAGREMPVSLICPGACSLPLDESLMSKDWSGRLTGDFYRKFEEQIGVSESTYTTEHGRNWVKDVRQKKDNHLFSVAG